MSKEEKQAIKIVNSLKEWGKTHFLVKDNSYARLSYNEVYVLLNFITKLQEERNRLKSYIKENEIYKKRLFKYAEKKDKQIDLMAEEIEYNGCIKRVWNCEEKSCKECIKQYFKEIAKEK